MVPEVRRAQIEVSKKGRPEQQIYGSQYGGKGPAKDHKNQQRNPKMGDTTQEDTKNNDKNKMIKNNKIRAKKTTSFFGFQPRKNMHKSIGDTIYIDENKTYAKNNQYKITEDKDNISYIDS